MAERRQHIVHLLIRQCRAGEDRFLLHPFCGWASPEGADYLILPSKRTVKDPLAPHIQGTPLDAFVDSILQNELGLKEDEYVLEEELPAIAHEMISPVHQRLTDYTIYPLDVWVATDRLESLQKQVDGEWLTCQQALGNPRVSSTSKAVFQLIQDRGESILQRPADHATMDGLALKWLSQNRGGTRYLSRQTLDRILGAGNRAFNLRVADPYLRYQMQGVGFTWSFFTEKDRQDVHIHPAPVVEIYGVIEGVLEIWWKQYHDRGTSAWCHRMVGPGDWIEVDSLQCHIVHWVTPGKGVVFKAGPGPLIGAGRLGEKGKTSCRDCPCMKPSEVVELERMLSGGSL